MSRTKQIVAITLHALTGCPAPFSRPTPSQSEYVHRYTPSIPTSEIVRIDYKYQGAVGGYATIAKIKVIDLKSLLDRQTPKTIEQYSPTGEMAELTRKVAEGRFKALAGSSLPKWFDAPLDRPMTVMTWERPDSTNGPGFTTSWYLDKTNNTIYLMSGGN